MALSLPAQLAAVAPEEKYEVSRVTRSAADPGCFSRIPDLVFCLCRISDLLDPKTATKERGEKKISCPTFFCSHKYHKIGNFLFLNWCRKKMLANYYTKNYRTYYPKNVILSSQSLSLGIRDPEKTYSGSRIQGSKRHRIPDPGSGSATLVNLFATVF
jgi:hypothetical protein